MSTQTPERISPQAGQAPDVELKLRPSKLFTIVALLAFVVGGFSALGGLGGIVYTYQQASVESITTPGDAPIPDAPVRGPLTMWSQSEAITMHQLDRTDGLRYAEMDREVPQVDEAGEPILDEAGEPVMGPNLDRLSWVDATALTTVLGVGIISYAFSAFAIAVGATLIGLGLVVFKLRRTAAAY
jgi:hypothetical protein